jgi:phosphodiesterase/alkaline phosphatase D-like protein
MCVGTTLCRAAWNRTLSTEGFRNLSLSTSFIATWNDHEVNYNWRWQNTTQFNILYSTALQAFKDAIPQREGPPSRSRIWRSLRWGSTLEIFVLGKKTKRKIFSFLFLSFSLE